MHRTSSGSPIGRSISGRNIPLFPISVQRFRSGWNPKISIDGSVYLRLAPLSPLLRIERRLESDVGDSDLGEEVVDHSDQMAQIQVPIRHEQLHLVELREVRRVHRLVSEHTVDREALHRLEALGVLRRLVQLLRAHRRRVRSQNVLHRLATVPLVAIAERSEASFGVDLRHVLQIVLRNGQRGGGVANEERVLRIARRVALRLEQRVEVPERRLHELVGGHLGEAHLQENLAELRSHHQQRMQIAALRLLAQRAEVVSGREEEAKESTA